MSEDDGSTPSDPPESAPEGDDAGPLGISRRTMVVGAAGIGLGSVLGVSYAVLGGSNPDQTRTVEPAEPDDDGTATLGELHYILENSGAESGRLNVTEFVYFPDDSAVRVSYRTRAGEVEDVPPQRQHVREVGQMVRMYAEYVAQGGDEADVVHAHIENPSEPAEQPDGYLVRREWVEKYNSGEWDGNETLNTVFGSGYTDEALANETADNSTTPSPTTTSE
ncbi:hypothetical protein [Halobacterium noricense]|uniref:hypothetical protein n=1 Tax=Halobacterium noricense TaxID=223182 RepID=UPI001E5E15D0|nr:hypothetical protein [Halobacterium noricense]UHH26408.1 hypothetical protein LT974_05580 [Halobacterium noricense]